jgi:hypothetical protein
MRATLLLAAIGVGFAVSAPAHAMLSAGDLERLCLARHLSAGTPEFNACVSDYYSTPDAAAAPPTAPEVDPAFARRSAECQSYGAQPGSQVFVNCMVQLSARDAGLQQQREQAEQEDEARQRELEFRRRAALADMIRNSYRPVQPVLLPPPPPPPMNRSLNCTSNAIGQYTYTNCH